MATVFAIILLLTLVVMLRSALGAPKSHEKVSHGTEEANGVVSEEHKEEPAADQSGQDHSIPQEEAGH